MKVAYTLQGHKREAVITLALTAPELKELIFQLGARQVQAKFVNGAVSAVVEQLQVELEYVQARCLREGLKVA